VRRFCGIFSYRNPLPLAVYGGICADDPESHSGLLAAGLELATQQGVKYLETRNCAEPYATALQGRNLYITFTRDLSAGPTN
jgi:hypothetical protein